MPGSMYIPYECNACQSSTLVIMSHLGGPWEVSCSNGHPWVIKPDSEITILGPVENVMVFEADRR